MQYGEGWGVREVAAMVAHTGLHGGKKDVVALVLVPTSPYLNKINVVSCPPAQRAHAQAGARGG